MLLVREFLEAGKCGIQSLFAIEHDRQRRQARLEGVAPRVLAENELVLRSADVLGTHDLVGFPVFEDAVLVNPRFVRKGVGANDCLVGLHGICLLYTSRCV